MRLAKIKYLRKKYLPKKKVIILLVGESVPFSGDYFYDKGLITTYTINVFRKVYGITFEDNVEFLKHFQCRGCYFDDLSLTPVDHLPPRSSERRNIVKKGIKPLSQRIQKMEPNVVVSIARMIDDYVKAALDDAQKQTKLQVKFRTVGYPGNGHQKGYKKDLLDILEQYSPNQYPAISKAITNADLDCFSELISTNLSALMDRNELGWTALHLISAQGVDTVEEHEEMARLSILKGADVNAQNNIGWTPLHCIASNGSRESLGVAKILLESGAKPNIEALINATPLMLWQHGEEIRNLLIENGAKIISPNWIQ